MRIARLDGSSRLANAVRQVSPYVGVVLLVPGGSLILMVLLVWSLRHLLWFAIRDSILRRTSEPTPASGVKPGRWVVDYDVARAQAIRWLGDRYLLANPINRPVSSQAAAAGGRAPIRV